MVDARKYHDRTKHTVSSVRESSFTLNRSNKAIACMAEAVKRLEATPHLHDDKLGLNSYTPTIAHTGNLANQVPEAETLVVDYRTVPAESQEDAIETVSDALHGIACEFKVSFYETGSCRKSQKIQHGIETSRQDRETVRSRTRGLTGTPIEGVQKIPPSRVSALITQAKYGRYLHPRGVW